MANEGLSPCPDTPNCVSSLQPDSRHYVEPLTFTGTAEDAREKLVRIIGALPRAEVIDETETYIHATFDSLLFRFTDDVEFLIDERANTVHMKSASRVGYSDLGVNRRRCEQIRKMFNQQDLD